MRKRDPQSQEDGFHLLLPNVAAHVDELIADFRSETDHGLRCWFLELIGAARAPHAFDLLAEQLESSDDSLRDWAARGLENLNTPEARQVLRRARLLAEPHSKQRPPTQVADLFPAFLAELQTLLLREKRPDLSQQLGQLPVVDRCRCGDADCSHFYTAPKPSGSYGPGHENLMLPTKQGLVVVDLVDGTIVGIEVLDRPDVKVALDRYLPPAARPKD